MKKIILIGLFFIGKLSADFDLEVIRELQSGYDANLKQQYPDADQKSDAERKVILSATIPSVFGELLSENWIYPGAQDWPIVDWAKVDGVEDFFVTQYAVLEQEGVIASTNEEAAKLGYVVSLLGDLNDVGDVWFRQWVYELAQSDQQKIKWLAYFSVDDLGEDFFRENPDKDLTVNWPAWQQAYNQSDKLGKGILLKCMTRLAQMTENWNELTQIHLSVFNGNDDGLKAIALVKGDNGLGDGVIDKWKDIVQNSTNAKLKNLAQEVLERQQIEIEQPE